MDRTLVRGGPDVLPASQYLQDRLQERRARNTRPKRARQSDFGPRKGRDDDIFCIDADEHIGTRFGSSPPSARSKADSEAAGLQGSRRRTLGVRDVNEQLDRLNKENFALKLELDHRRDATAKLQDQIDGAREQIRRAQQLEKEHAELLHINGQLVIELEKRDQAVEEAVDNINDLEDETTDLKAENAALRERLETRTSTTRPSTANADSGYAGTETNEQVPPSSPPQLSMAPKAPHVRPPPAAASVASRKLFSALHPATPAKIRREPLILSQRKTSSQALRSVFLEASRDLQPVKSFASLLSRRDPLAGDDEVVLDSPSLSVLSESSFPSLYSPKKQLSPDQYDWEVPGRESSETPVLHLRQDSINRVSRWMSDADLPEETPSKSNRLSMPVSESTIRAMSTSPVPTITEDEQFQSIDTMSTTPIGASPSKAEKRQLASFARPLPLRLEMEKTRFKQSRLAGMSGPIFGEPLLPPTPDSASTRMLRGARSSIAEDRSLLDMTPAPVKSFAALEPGVRTAPRQMRSSVELKSAYSNNLRHRQNLFSGNQNDDSSSDENGDAPTGTANDLIFEHDDFPDGNSILVGTPSRFFKAANGPRNAPVFFDASDISPPQLARNEVRRRQSSSGASSGPRKSSFGRMGTSPTFLGTLGRLVSSASKSTVASANSGAQSLGDSANLISPRSAYSGSSGIRTVVQPADRNSAISPDIVPTQSRMPTAPASTLSQKTQKIFRRLSNSQSERELPRSPHEKSPLPTLTSTPSSAYVNTIPISMRRPSTAEAARQSTDPRPPSAQRDRRPSMTGRTKTAPPDRSTSIDRTVEKVSFFKRSNSVKNVVGSSPKSATVTPLNDRDGPGVSRRRASVRDAVATNLSRRQCR